MNPWSPNTRRHVVGQTVFVMPGKIDVPSTAVSRLSNKLVLLDSERRLQILQQLRTALQHGAGNTGHTE